MDFLSGLFKVPTLSDIVFVRLIKKELGDPSKFLKTCPDSGIDPLSELSGVLKQPEDFIRPTRVPRPDKAGLWLVGCKSYIPFPSYITFSAIAPVRRTYFYPLRRHASRRTSDTRSFLLFLYSRIT